MHILYVCAFMCLGVEIKMPGSANVITSYLDNVH